MRILISGGSGSLGVFCNEYLDQKHKILTVWNSNPGNCFDFNNVQGDITNRKFLEAIFKMHKPDVVLHLATVASIQQAEGMDENYLYDVNVGATKNIAELCNEYNARMIYTSSEQVYDGEHEALLTEDAPIAPPSKYAKLKLKGEEAVTSTSNNFIILRVGLLYGLSVYFTRNFFNFMYNSFSEGKKVNLFHDQMRNPLAIHDAARIIGDIIDSDIKNEILNFGGIDVVSRVDMGNKLCELAGFDKSLINPTSMKDIPNLAVGRHLTLDMSRLKSYGIEPQPMDAMIKEMLYFISLEDEE